VLRSDFGLKNLSANDALWRMLSVRRGALAPISFLTDASDIETSPIVETSPGSGLCTSGNGLFLAVFLHFEEALLNQPSTRDRYLRNRDRWVEQSAERVLKPFFGPTAQFYSGLSETPAGQYEHDLVIHWRDLLFV